MDLGIIKNIFTFCDFASLVGMVWRLQRVTYRCDYLADVIYLVN